MGADKIPNHPRDDLRRRHRGRLFQVRIEIKRLNCGDFGDFGDQFPGFPHNVADEKQPPQGLGISARGRPFGGGRVRGRSDQRTRIGDFNFANLAPQPPFKYPGAEQEANQGVFERSQENHRGAWWPNQRANVKLIGAGAARRPGVFPVLDPSKVAHRQLTKPPSASALLRPRTNALRHTGATPALPAPAVESPRLPCEPRCLGVDRAGEGV